jgi:PKD repeat protein
MKSLIDKRLGALVILQLLILSFLAVQIKNVSGQERTIKILSITDSNGITLGNETEPLPPEGIPFTVKIFLDGFTSNLATFQVGLKFDPTFLKCTAAWIPSEDPLFVFYNKDFYALGPSISDTEVVLGGVLRRLSDAVTIQRGLLAMINFTAIHVGNTTINFIPEPVPYAPMYTMLLDMYAQDIPYTTESFSLTVISLPPPPSPPIANFTFYPKMQKNITFSGDVTKVINDPLNSTWSDSSKCVGWIDYESLGLSTSDLLYMRELSGSNSTWLVKNLSKDSSGWKLDLQLWSWSDLTVTFDASGSYDPDGSIVSYFWDFGDNTTGTGKIISHKYEKRGFYQANLTVVDNESYQSSVVLYITVGYRPKAMFFTSPAGYPIEAIPPNENVTFNVTDTFHPENVNIALYTWNFGDGNISATPDPITTHTYNKRGIYIVNLTVTDDDGISSFVIKEIQIGIPPLAQSDYFPKEPTTKDVITFDASSSRKGGQYEEFDIVLYKWEFDDGTIVETNETTVSHNFETAGDWNVTLTVYDIDGLRDSFTQTITVKEIASTGQAGFSPYIVAVIIVIAIIVVVVVIKRRRGEEEALEI